MTARPRADASAADGATIAPMTRRQQLMWGLFDFGTGRGLEIGPLHQPVVPPDRADVAYVDVFDRDQLVRNWADDPGVPVEQIPEIDYALFDGERVRSIPEAVGPDVRFDWVFASHVLEHVPDVIGWLDQIARVTVDGGSLVLAVPDRRYCFDLHRPGTSVGQMLQANELGDTVPSVRAVFDYKRGHASVRAPDVWAGKVAGYEQRIYSLETVLEQVARARAGEYIDSHVWTFTPGSLLEQLVELRALGLSAWKVRTVVPTRRNELEFYAILERLPRDGDWTPELLADEPPLPARPDWLTETVQVAADLAAARAELATLRAENATLRGGLASRRRTRATVRGRELARLADRVKRRLRRSPAGPALVRLRRVVRRRPSA